MSKKIFIISAGLFGLLLMASLAWYFYFAKNNENTETTELQPTSNQPSQTPSSSNDNAKVKQVVEGKVLGTAVKDLGSNLIYYSDSNFLQLDTNTLARINMGAYPFSGATEITWSSDRHKAIVKAVDGYYYYNLDTNSTLKLKDGLDIVNWTAKGDRILYKYYDKDRNERSLNIADPDGTNWKELKKTNLRKLEFLSNPSTNEVEYYQSPDSFSKGELWGMSSDGTAERKIFSDHYGADFLWSPDGKKLTVSFVTQQGGRFMELGLANENGGEYKTLGFPTTVKKCVWSKDNIHLYCAMIGAALKDGDVLPNDWESGKFDSADTFWKINTQNGKKERVIELTDINQSYDAANLMLDGNEKYLFFVDRKTKGLFRISL